jgi:pimeloyl-ACP methyl ester carboxylesterase
VPRSVLITGSHHLLAGHLAARYRRYADTTVVLGDALAPADEMWLLHGECTPIDTGTALPREALHVVVPASYPHPTGMLADRCAAAGIAYRVVRTGDLVGDPVGTPDPGRTGILGFLHTLLSVRREISERLPDYFDREPLRCLAPAGAVLDLVPVDDASEALYRLNGTGSRYHLRAARPVPFADLCARISRSYDLKLLAVEEPAALNAVDRYLRDRLADVLPAGQPPAPDGLDAWRASGIDPAPVRLDDLLDSARTAENAAVAAQRARVARLPAPLARPVTGARGTRLTYYVGGHGDPPLVILNALGQRVTCWLPLLDRLMPGRRVVVWEMRGVRADQPLLTFDEQLTDLEAVLADQGIDRCHLLGWCTGAKLALRYHQRHPGAVASIVVLNGTFKHTGRPSTLDSPYERNLETVCRTLDRRPELAGRMRRLFTEGGSGTADDGATTDGAPDDGDPAVAAMRAKHPALRDEALRPFATEAGMVRYARQLVDMWSVDATAGADRVRIPLLFLGSEYDDVVAPAAVRAAAELFPTATHAEIPGASHYCMYDRSGTLGDLVERFLAG